ncbi:type VI secretion system membrane subunit TssM [Aquabacter sp. L1I39]|uniref:type VI secretion system membrane subunit TssM n=1 Tax=Aquabacter sp. L1I39 TaxID=2820278 RepID=UPI001ADA6201|nr:type VI secretion system membrane subunit TssM [Aquabacter sp. L1I39]QTL01706.1 type VI secretion system membrane subunit TssM [Aquabacter sp. L1I39]
MPPRPSWTFWRWVVLVVGALLLAALVWFVLPHVSVAGHSLLPDLSSRILALILVAVLSAMIALFWVLGGQGDRMARRENVRADQPREVRIRHVREQERGFRLAMGVLRRIRKPRLLSSNYRYELPWYAIIGPKGAGKTALLHASGLRFPLNERRSGRISAGALGFSFTEHAVVVEANFFSSPDEEVGLITTFGTLLRRYRARQPLNGVILVMSLPEVLAASEVTRFSFHADLREQLERLQREVRRRIPVYVVLSHMDQVPGFETFTANLSTSERRGVFGLTLPLYDEKGTTTKGRPLAATVATEFDHFLQWQRPRTLTQVNAAFEVQERLDCFLFVPQLATLKPMIAELVEDVFRPTDFERPLLLRGLYFAAAPHVPANAPSLAPTVDAEGKPAERRSEGYFIRDLLEKVVFAEAGLAERDPTSRRREAALRWGLTALGGIAAAAMILWWSVSFVANRYQVEDLSQATQKAQQVVNDLGSSIQETAAEQMDLSAVVPTLNALENLPTGWVHKDEPRALRMGGGLSQTAYLSAVTVQEYKDALLSLLLPRLETVVQKAVTDSLGVPQDLYGSLMVYLMLGGAGPMNRDAISDWMRRYLIAAYPGPAQAPLRTAILEHVRNLLAIGFPPLELNQQLVSQARTELSAYPSAERGMSELLKLPEIMSMIPWRLTDVAGPLSPYALTRRSGKPLSTPIAGMYTADQFFAVVLPAIDRIAQRLASEDWVRFPSAPDTPPGDRAAQLRREIRALYVSDYIAEWQNLLSDVAILPFDSLQMEVAVLQALIGPPSPLDGYLKSVAQQTTLTPPAPPDPTKTAAEPFRNMIPGGEAPAPSTPMAGLAQTVTEHFSGLHRFVTGQPSPLEEVLKAIGQLRMVIGPAASVGSGNPGQLTELTAGAGFAQILSQLKLSTVTAPPGLADSILGLVRQTSSITNAGVRADLDATWKTQILPFCQQAIGGRYPFAISSSDTTLADFTRMFGPDGLLDHFFDRQLKPFVDMSVSPWKMLANTGAAPDITPQGLALFEQADRIRTMFFPQGTTAPQLTFEITPTDLDAGAMRVRLDIDGQWLLYQYGPPQSVAFKWPGATSGVRLEFGTSTPGQPSSFSVSGPWALLRFIGGQKLVRQGPSRFAFTVTLGPRSASFILDAASVNNPFRQNPLAGFRCLPSLVAG